jgi:predicted outer membrane lipoprotein
MEILFIPALVVAVWLVLSHIRKQQFLKEYMELQRKALEKGVALPDDLKQLATAKTDWAAVTLRVGIISLVLGIMGAVIGMLILPNQSWNPKDADSGAFFASFWVFGLLLAAFGVGNLICWFLIDKRRRDKIDKGE